MTSPSNLLPLLLRHSLPHIPAHGFSPAALSRASLSLPPPFQYSDPLTPAAIATLFGSGREPQRALVREWLSAKREDMQAQWKGKGKQPELRDVLRSRLEMNEEVRHHLADAFALFSITATPLPVLGVGIKTPFPLLNHSLYIADDALTLSSSSRQNLHQSLPLSILYLSTELHQLSLPLSSSSSMPSTTDFLDRRLEEYNQLQGNIDMGGDYVRTAWNAVRGAVKSRV